jgi:hypothetical protein
VNEAGTPASEKVHLGENVVIPDIVNRLERFQAKWKPVRVQKTRQIKNLEPRFDSIETEKALGRERAVSA